jgi:hypothetical protein
MELIKLKDYSDISYCSGPFGRNEMVVLFITATAKYGSEQDFGLELVCHVGLWHGDAFFRSQ